MSDKLVIMDWAGKETETDIDLDNLEDIFMIRIYVITGDEIAEIIYKNGDVRVYDSSKDRIQDFHDDEYVIYGPNRNIINEFKKRESSYFDWEDFVNE